MRSSLKYWSLLICLSLLLGLTSGCKTSGEKMITTAKEKIHEGMPREQVLAKMGKPVLSMRGFDEIAIDQFITTLDNPSHRPGDAGYKGATSLTTVSVRYNAERKVEKVLYSTGNVIWNNKSYGTVAGGNITHVLDTRLIKKGETTLQQLVTWYGEPTARALSFDDEETYVWYFVSAGPLTGLKADNLRIWLDPRGKVASLVILEDWNWDY